MMDCPRVLVISHNVFSDSGNMGKTLASYFRGWDIDRLAQLYFHAELPTKPVCAGYYRFSDADALRAVFWRARGGRAFGPEDIEQGREDPSDKGRLAGVYQAGRKRSPLIYLARDAVWRLSAWENRQLLEWLDRFSPEIIFLASGDYAFPYRIARRLAERYRIPLAVCCFDDYYLYNKNEGRFLGRFRQRLFMRTVRKTMGRAGLIFTLSEAMADAYAELFRRPCRVLYAGSSVSASAIPQTERAGIAYLGGLSLGRGAQLAEIGRCLRAMQGAGTPEAIDVYSAETDLELLREMKSENGIRFHGAVAGAEVPEIISRCLAVIHTESFDPAIRQRVAYSFSTKIPDCLAVGTCILAYGPAEQASIDYLTKHEAAVVVTRPEELPEALRRICTDPALRERLVRNALSLAEKNHRGEIIPAEVCAELRKLIIAPSRR